MALCTCGTGAHLSLHSVTLCGGEGMDGGGGAEPLGEESQAWRVLIKLSAKMSGNGARGPGCRHELGRPATAVPNYIYVFHSICTCSWGTERCSALGGPARRPR